MPSDTFLESPSDVQILFGKHRGQTLPYIPPDYIDWCIHPNQKHNAWFNGFKDLVQAYRSSPEYPGSVRVWFGEAQKGIPIKRLPRGFIDWCTFPEGKKYCKWFDQFRGLVELYDSKFNLRPGSVEVWFGRFEGTPIKDVPRWYIDYATHPEQAQYRWHLGFKRLYEAHRKTLPEVKPGTELLWFGVPKYRGIALNIVYSMDRKYILWCADPKRASNTWYPEFIRIFHNYLEKREKRPYRPRARTELIRDTGDKCGPWDDDVLMEDDEYDTTDGFVEPDWEPEEWEDYGEPEARGYKEEPDASFADLDGAGEGADGAGEESDSDESQIDKEEELCEGHEEEEEEEEAHFTDGDERATTSSVCSDSDQDLAWSVASSNNIADSGAEATSESEGYVEPRTTRQRRRARRMLVDSEGSGEELPSPSRLFASDPQDDANIAMSNEEEMEGVES
ncbi:hypothetical protein EYR40_004960 [Pleurotus pulmonarius]|nr:hypothetical protein EYR36_006661 [Pleurotus pulmonarius]KAF4601356.1 hypothetical protein EYR38_006009 [Pleurotus pulmonarius]KAF4601761.1 hypothetical protein EYR40_004960 [Pleurotus pulmonarius]